MPPALALALNFSLDGTAPAWVQLLPAGPTVAGADGRTWTLDDPVAVAAAFQGRAAPLVIDWEHASEHRAPHGLDAPAAGWIDTVEVRPDGLWGHVEWTERAAQQIQAREYRFLSPVFQYEKASSRIVRLTSAGLTNQPNLDLVALNRQEPPMTLPTALCSALDLPADAEESAVLTALNALRQRAAQPPLETFVPRADYDAALARASNAEQQLATRAQAQRDEHIENALNQALKSGQICPATVEFYRAGCQKDGGLEAFDQFLKTAPPVLGPTPELRGQPPAPDDAAVITRAFNRFNPAAQAA